METSINFSKYQNENKSTDSLRLFSSFFLNILGNLRSFNFVTAFGERLTIGGQVESVSRKLIF